MNKIQHFKNLLNNLKKEAIAPPPLGSDSPAAPTSTAPVTPTQHVSSMTHSSEIKDMQMAMQSLADSVMRDAHSQTMAFKPNDALQPEAPSAQVAAKKGFNDFIAEQYLGALDDSKKGVEWTTDPSVTTHPAKSRTQTDIYELDVIMDTFRRIGLGSKEFSADGSWGFRTDNALRNIMGFAYGLLQLEGDFGFKNDYYSLNSWKQFNSLLSGYTIKDHVISLPLAEQNKRAIVITKHLKAISNLYSDFRRQVTAKPEFRPLLEGNRSFEKYSPSGTNTDVLDEHEEKILKETNFTINDIQYKAPNLPNGTANSIPLNALTSKESFENYLKEVGWTQENIDGGVAAKILNVIKQQLNKDS